MPNLTIAIDEQLLRAARVKAVQQGTSVNEICRQAIEAYARNPSDTEARVNRLRVLAGKGQGDRGPLWPGRDAFYADPGSL